MSDAAPRLVRGPKIRSCCRIFDSALWDGYRPRPDDVIIATYPKCGTTWTQRIVGMLIFQSDAPFPVQNSSPWPDMRIMPPGVALELAESQTHRRFLKSHLPLDALPMYEGVKVIHVARDGRDAAMSFHNHKLHYTPQTLARMAEVNSNDPLVSPESFSPDPDPAVHFHEWITSGFEDHLGDPTCGFWYMENSYWQERDNPDLLLVHYADLKQDLGGEMRRIAAFLGIETPAQLWPQLVEAARFESMKAKADDLLPDAGQIWQGGGKTFLNKGVNGRWCGVLHGVDLDLYDARVKAEFAPELAAWIEHGRLGG